MIRLGFLVIFIVLNSFTLHAQITLSRENLAEVCNCDIQSVSLNLVNKKIASINSNTFKGLNNLQEINTAYFN